MFIDRSQFQFNLLSTNKTICYRKQQQKPDTSAEPATQFATSSYKPGFCLPPSCWHSAGVSTHTKMMHRFFRVWDTSSQA